MDGKNIEWDNYFEKGLPWWLSSKESACNVGVSGDTGSVPGLERSSGGGHGNPWTEELGGLQSMGSQRVGHD